MLALVFQDGGGRVSAISAQFAAIMRENYTPEQWLNILVQTAKELDLDPRPSPWYGDEDCMHVVYRNVRLEE